MSAAPRVRMIERRLSIAQQLVDHLREQPPMTVSQLERCFEGARDRAALAVDLRVALSENPNVFLRTDPSEQFGRYVETWHLASRVVPQPPRPPATPVAQPELYAWQVRALTEWRSAGERGIVEAVTGSGKTKLALAAISQHIAEGGRACVIAPSIELVTQWEREAMAFLKRSLGRRPQIGILTGEGGANRSWPTCDSHELVIGTPHSASRIDLLVGPSQGLLVADECHRYGAEGFARALQHTFPRRLGLTATLERADDGVSEVLMPYFGTVSYRLGYQEALEDGVIAPFKIAFVGVQFTPRERHKYDDASATVSETRTELIESGLAPKEPFGAFMLAVAALARIGDSWEAKLARRFLAAFQARRAVLAEARDKLERVGELSPAVRAATRTIAFAQTRAAAELVVGELAKHGVAGAALDSSMATDARRKLLAGFEDGDHDLIAAPLLLDEGVNVPAADLALVLATARSRRQLIQRVGRVIRVKDDARLARIVVLFVESTSEDPRGGANEDFIEAIRPAARDIRVYPSHTKISEICAYLNDWVDRGQQNTTIPLNPTFAQPAQLPALGVADVITFIETDDSPPGGLDGHLELTLIAARSAIRASRVTRTMLIEFGRAEAAARQVAERREDASAVGILDFLCAAMQPVKHEAQLTRPKPHELPDDIDEVELRTAALEASARSLMRSREASSLESALHGLQQTERLATRGLVNPNERGALLAALDQRCTDLRSRLRALATRPE